MRFVHPLYFAGLIAVIALGVGYLLVVRRTRTHTLRFANYELLDAVAPRRPSAWRHTGFAIVMIGLTLLVIALAGPAGEQKVPRNRATVMLAIDVSLSMEATDIAPNRLAAAQEAAEQFVTDLTPGVNLGVISFAGIATVLVSPTTDRAPALAAIQSLTLDERTATGEAIISALQTIDMFSRTVGGSTDPVPARIVLMTDGKRTVGRTEQDAAQRAKEAGIPVSVIAFGTDHGSVTIDDEVIPVPLDTEAMRDIAAITGGDFHTAHSAEELKKVYAQLGDQIGYEIVDKDLSRPWLLAGTVCLLLGLGVTLAVSKRIP